jgi:Flp pilus assembly protein TadB
MRYCDLKVWLIRTSGAWVLCAVLAAVLFAVAYWACILVVALTFLGAIGYVAREWWRVARRPRRRSGMDESRLPQTDDYVPGTLTLRTARARANDRRR